MEIFKRKKKKQLPKDVVQRNHKEVAKALEILFASEYMDRKTLYLQNFLRGMAFSVGGVLGATLLIGLVIWILSLFDQIPLIGPLFENTRESIENN